MFGPASLRIRGPLQAHVEGFWLELLRQGYAPASAANQLRFAAHLSKWIATEGLALGDLTESVVARFLRHRRRGRCTRYYTRRGLEPLLGYLRFIGMAPGARTPVDATPADRLVREYAEYLSQERGLVATSIRAYTRFARGFMAAECPLLDWDRLTAAMVTKFVLRRSRRASRACCRLAVTHLRSFLRFLHLRGSTAHDLAGGVPAVAGWRLSALPVALDDDQIHALFRCFDPSRLGRRDAAIVRLLVRLGLRAGEVAALRIEDINWRAGEIVVRGKGRHESRLPLPPDVGRAIAVYLRRGRPCSSCRSLFLLSLAPYTGMLPGAVIAVARRALRRAGVLAGGAHLLRHTAATQLLRRGASLSEIAHVLRHRHLDTTAIYAKVDIASLGALARPWPGGTP